MPKYRDVPGYPGYQAGSDGTLWRNRPFQGREAARRGDFYQVKTYVAEHGYESFRLKGADGKYKIFYVHRFVLLAFFGEPPGGMIACHWDGNRANNLVSNLRWDTQIGNRRDAVRHGTHKKGESVSNSKLTEEIVKFILGRPHGSYKSGSTRSNERTELAKRFGVHPRTISAIWRREQWAWVEAPDASS